IVALCLSENAQVTSAQTIARFIKSNFPKIILAVLKDDKIDAAFNFFSDHVFSLKALDQFMRLAGTLTKKASPWPVIPDFEGLPLTQYLVPELVIPLGVINARESYMGNTQVLNSVMSHISGTLGAKAFSIQDRAIDLNHLKDMIGFPDKKGIFSLYNGLSATHSYKDKFDYQSSWQKGLRLINWHISKTIPKINALYGFSKEGIWNHLILPDKMDNQSKNQIGSMISISPNIAHSFENKIHWDETSAAKYEIDPCLQPYSKVTNLPGKPLWQILEDPAMRLLYLNFHGKRKLFCQRVQEKHRSIFSLGSNLSFYFKAPKDLPQGFLDEIIKMVDAGGSVALKWVRYNLERAYLIAYAVENGVIVGNSSLKFPRQEFIDRVKKNTGLDFTNHLERGYTSVRPEYRALGIGKKLLEGLTQRAKEYKIFSVISEDNLATQKIAIRNKTRKVATYYSEIMGKEVGLWMPEWMIDKQDS
ncbi:MAG: GNAT family N-acetyltransferase, partial [Desulfobacteraceae bacterium]|nr:GNAT family N-acetyltransferase [Desulfobacteraceae bacterium]